MRLPYPPRPLAPLALLVRRSSVLVALRVRVVLEGGLVSRALLVSVALWVRLAPPANPAPLVLLVRLDRKATGATSARRVLLVLTAIPAP